MWKIKLILFLAAVCLTGCPSSAKIFVYEVTLPTASPAQIAELRDELLEAKRDGKTEETWLDPKGATVKCLVGSFRICTADKYILIVNPYKTSVGVSDGASRDVEEFRESLNSEDAATFQRQTKLASQLIASAKKKGLESYGPAAYTIWVDPKSRKVRKFNQGD